jgi:hypothetical protein
MATCDEERKNVFDHLTAQICTGHWPPSDDAQAFALMNIIHNMQLCLK